MWLQDRRFRADTDLTHSDAHPVFDTFVHSAYPVFSPVLQLGPPATVRGRKNALLRLRHASSSVLQRLFTRKPRSSKLALLRDLYADYRALTPPQSARTAWFRLRGRPRRYGTMENSSEDTSAPLSRRQRLLGLAKSTRDTYMPRIAGLVTLLAGVARAETVDANTLPPDSTVTLFPAYTRLSEGSQTRFLVNVNGWLSCPGLMTRKNRLILSLAKQITRYGNATQAVSQLENDKLRQDLLDDSDSELVVSETPLAASPGDQKPPNWADDLIKERLASFIARSVPYAGLSVTVGSRDRVDPEVLVTVPVSTDASGYFNADVAVDYVPSVVQVRAVADESIFAFQDVLILPHNGVGVISDIDDTCKLTGVIGDKRELMTNLLLNDFTLWAIPLVVAWYGRLHEKRLSFHYVSNLPWQLFLSISQYFAAVKLPAGSVHLKQYTGNIIASLMEPLLSRKKRALYRILDDFPSKKFICVGDSGEHDLEAYVDLAATNPGRVLAIYIRFVPDSFSDVDDARIFNEVKRMVAMYREKSTKSPVVPQDIENLIDLSDDPAPTAQAAERLAKLPPLVPRKPKNLKGNQVTRLPPLPAREGPKSAPGTAFQEADLISGPPDPIVDVKTAATEPAGNPGVESPPLPKRPANSTQIDAVDNLQHLFNVQSMYELEDTDRKGAQWLQKVASALEVLEGTGTEIVFFHDSDEELLHAVDEVLLRA